MISRFTNTLTGSKGRSECFTHIYNLEKANTIFWVNKGAIHTSSGFSCQVTYTVQNTYNKAYRSFLTHSLYRTSKNIGWLHAYNFLKSEASTLVKLFWTQILCTFSFKATTNNRYWIWTLSHTLNIFPGMKNILIFHPHLHYQAPLKFSKTNEKYEKVDCWQRIMQC